MRNNTKPPKIEVLVLDDEGYETDARPFDFLKEARAWIKERALDADYWDRRAEVPGWATRNVHTIRLMKNGECIDDWFPTFTKEEAA